MDIEIPKTLEDWNAAGADYLPGHLGLTFLTVEPSEVVATLPAGRVLSAWNGFLHAGTVVSLADTCCGYGTLKNLPDDATGFTTIELKTNFLSTVREGIVRCIAKPLSVGRTTQVWDATVSSEGRDRVIPKAGIRDPFDGAKSVQSTRRGAPQMGGFGPPEAGFHARWTSFCPTCGRPGNGAGHA